MVRADLSTQSSIINPRDYTAMNFKTLSLSVIAAVCIASSASACWKDNTVVTDMRASNVTDARGNCVFTKWKEGANKCAAAPAAVKAAAPGNAPLATLNERTIYFDFDSAELTATSIYKLNRLLGKIKASGRVLSASIVGHADMMGDPAYNQALSARRATAVKNYLASQGFNNAQVTTVTAEGENAPVTQGCDKAGARAQAINCLQPDRRVEIQLTVGR